MSNYNINLLIRIIEDLKMRSLQAKNVLSTPANIIDVTDYKVTKYTEKSLKEKVNLTPSDYLKDKRL